MTTLDPGLGTSALTGNLFGTFRLPDDLAFVVETAAGAVLHSTDGSDYIDHVLGSGPMVLGHAHPRVVEGLQAQAARGTTFYALNEPALRLAARIVELVPCAEGVKFLGSGSEATFYAMRIARAATGRRKILKFEGAYHGHNDYSLHGLKSSAEVAYPRATPDSSGIPAEVSETMLLAPFNDLETVERILDEHGSSVAAVVVEPVQRAFLPVDGFLAGLRAACDRVGALLVFDEVVTGFRLSLGGAQEVYGVTPDLCALGKVLGGGLPLAAVAGRRDLIELTVPGAPPGSAVYLSGTLNGNPLAAVAGLTTIAVLEEEDGCAKLAAFGTDLVGGVLDLGDRLSVAMQVIGPPSFPQIIFGEEAVIDHRSLLRTDLRAAEMFGRELIRRGIFVHPGSKVYVSTAHTPEQLDRFLTAAEESLAVVRDAGLLEAR